MKSNSLLFFKTLADLGVQITLTPEQAREIAEALFSNPNMQTIMDKNTEIAILKDKLNTQLGRLFEIVSEIAISNTICPGMGFPRYEELRDVRAYRDELVLKIKQLERELLSVRP